MPNKIGANTDFFTEGIRNQALVDRIAVLEAGAAASSSQTLTLPEPHEPFAVAYRPTPQGCVANLPIDLPNTTDRLVIVVIAHSDRDTAAHFTNRRKENSYIVTDDNRQAQTGNFDFGFLKYNTLYDLLRLKGIDADGGARAVNPPDDPAIGDVALETFTTPAAYGSPSAPHVGNILENKLDDVTKAFDAFIKVQVIAPFLSTSTTGGISTTIGSTTVTKTTNFSGVSVGMGFTVNGETHIVVSVGTNTLTVDFAYQQTLSGQTATFGTLQTWGSIKTDPAQETGLPATRVIARFRLNGTSENINKSYYFSNTEAAATSIIFRVDGFIAARKYDWAENAIVETAGEATQRVTITPLTTQSFIAGGFKVDTPGIPELTGAAFKYDPTDRDNFKLTRFYITQPTPAVALDTLVLERRNAGTGTISYTSGSTTITGSGTTWNTAATTDIAVGNTIVIGTYLAVGYQRLVVQTINSDTSITVEVAPNASSGGSVAFKIGHILDEHPIRKQKWHLAGQQIKFNLGNLKVKKLLNQDFVVIITSQLGNQREDVDNFTTGADGPVPADTDVPSGLGTPGGHFIAKVGVNIDGMTISTQWNAGKEKSIVIYDGATTYFDLPTYISTANTVPQTVQAAASESAARYPIGPGKEHITLGVRLKDLKTILGTTAKAYFYGTNAIGTSSKSSDSGNIITNGQDIVSGRDAVNVVDVGVTLDTKLQLAINGDMLYNDGGANVNGWTKGSAASSTAITTTTTDDIFWDSASHRLKWINKASSLVQNFRKRVVKGDYYAISFQVATDGSFGSGTLTIQFVDASDVTIVQAAATLNLNTITSTYQLVGAVVQLDTTSDYTGTGPQKFLKFSTASTLSSTNNIIIDKIMVNRGKSFGAFAPRVGSSGYEGDGTGPGTSENISLTTVNNVTVIDVGNPVGTQGGGVGVGTSGIILPSTL